MSDVELAGEELANVMKARAQALVDRKYVARADERQKAMGLAYVEAERQDLAKEIALFTLQQSALLMEMFLNAED